MALNFPCYIFGRITDSGSDPVVGATVTATDNTYGGTATDTTGANGEYAINLDDNSSTMTDSNITISCTDSGESGDSSFNLDVSIPFLEIDLSLSAVAAECNSIGEIAMDTSNVYGNETYIDVDSYNPEIRIKSICS